MMALFSNAASLVERLGLRRSNTGRRLIASVNVIGQRFARWLYLRRQVPLVVGDHRLFLSDRLGPSVGFVSSLIHDRYELDMKRLLENSIQEGMTVLDIGAHVGYYTVMAARKVGPSGHVYAFEPDPENYALLTKNIELNEYRNVTCMPSAISDRSGVTSLFVSRQGNDRHTLIEDPRAVLLGARREVPSITVDEFMKSLGWPRLDLIKVDVEGAEPLVVAGMRETLRRTETLSLIIEFAPEILRAGGVDPLTFLDFLRKQGLTLAPVEADMATDALTLPNLKRSIADIEKRGAINVVCQKLPASQTAGTVNL